MWTCPKCQSIYDDAAIECWRCKRPGANGLRVFRPAVVRAVPSGEIVPQPAPVAAEPRRKVDVVRPAPEADAEPTE